MYNLEITFEVSIAEWRIDNPRDPRNAEWCLWVFDRNLQKWIPTSDCTRPGESVEILHVKVIDDSAKKTESKKTTKTRKEKQ